MSIISPLNWGRVPTGRLFGSRLTHKRRSANFDEPLCKIRANGPDLRSHRAGFQSKGGPWLNRSTSSPPDSAARLITGRRKREVLRNIDVRHPESPQEHQLRALVFNHRGMNRGKRSFNSTKSSFLLSFWMWGLAVGAGCQRNVGLEIQYLLEAVNGSTLCSCCANDSRHYGINLYTAAFRMKKWRK